MRKGSTWSRPLIWFDKCTSRILHFKKAKIRTFFFQFGDPKDAIRGPTKNIIKLICNIYPASKVSPYILDGLKSKNARQRAGTDIALSLYVNQACQTKRKVLIAVPARISNRTAVLPTN